LLALEINGDNCTDRQQDARRWGADEESAHQRDGEEGFTVLGALKTSRAMPSPMEP
jgi:hypothetical protein